MGAIIVFLMFLKHSESSFLGKSVDLPIAMSISCSCVCVCVSVCKYREHMSNLGENQKCKK